MKKCFNCNKEFDNGIDFCPSCGSRLSENDATVVANEPAPAVAPAPQPAVNQVNNEPVSIGEWMVMLVQFIPCVGWLVWLIVLLVWAFGDNVKQSKKTFAKANLIVMLAVLILVILFYAVIIGAGLSLANVLADFFYQLR